MTDQPPHDTADDEEREITCPISRPIRLWVQWSVGFIEIAPESLIWFVHDGGDVRIPARNEEHARYICESLQFAEFIEPISNSFPKWLHWTRILLIHVIKWLNRRDYRWRLGRAYS